MSSRLSTGVWSFCLGVNVMGLITGYLLHDAALTVWSLGWAAVSLDVLIQMRMK